MKISRREFGATTLAAAAFTAQLKGAASAIDEVLRTGIARRKIPCVAAMVATPKKITYQGAFGTRDASGVLLKPDSIFAVASMVKPITSTAVMQLVEQGKVQLDEPMSKYLPELGTLQVFEGVTAGKPVLRPARTPITLKHLLTHTSGLAYDPWSEEMQRFEEAGGPPPSGVAPLRPLIFEPGTRWQYGYSVDFAGKLVEKLSGLTLEEYFQRNILQPLGMTDTSFILPAAKFDRLVSGYGRDASGELQHGPRMMPPPPTAYSGGAGIYTTAPDYIRFMQMILRHGRAADGKEILKPATVAMMTTNQIGELGAGKLKSYRPAQSSDVDFHPGHRDGWGLGFLIFDAAIPGGRSAGSLCWGGISNTFFWIDPKRSLCAVIMMQFLPFVDKEAMGLLGEFERAVYAG